MNLIMAGIYGWHNMVWMVFQSLVIFWRNGISVSFLACWRGASNFLHGTGSLQWLDVEVCLEIAMFTIVWLSINLFGEFKF